MLALTLPSGRIASGRNLMRILYLSTQIPVPANSGYAIRMLSLLRAIAALGHSVDFLSLATDSAYNLQPLFDCCSSVATVLHKRDNMSRSTGYFGRLVALARGRPYAVDRFTSPEMRERITQILATTKYDCVFGDSIYALVNLMSTDVPVVLNCHNVEWVIFQKYAALERNPVKRVYATLEMRRLRNAERRACDRSVIAMTCSENDLRALQALRSDLPIFVVPNCVDTSYARPNMAASNDAYPPTVLFQGVMDWYPNRDAAEFFLSKMLPAIRREIPEIKVIIAGRNPPDEFRRNCVSVPSVEVTGTVPDMRPYLERASIVVVPLRIGSGTRIKILEAAAAGKAVVSTSVGAEGLCFEDQVEIVIADKPEIFAQEVIGLLRNRERRNSIGEAARAKVVGHYGHEAVAKTIQGVMATLDEEIRRTDNSRRDCAIESSVASSGQ